MQRRPVHNIRSTPHSWIDQLLYYRTSPQAGDPIVNIRLGYYDALATVLWYWRLSRRSLGGSVTYSTLLKVLSRWALGARAGS